MQSTIHYLEPTPLAEHQYALVSHNLILELELEDQPSVYPLGIAKLAPQVNLYPYLIDTHHLTYLQHEAFWQALRSYSKGKERYPGCFFLFNLLKPQPIRMIQQRLHRSLFYPRQTKPEMILRYYDPRVMVPFSIIEGLPHPASLFLDDMDRITYYLDGEWKTQALPQTHTTYSDRAIRGLLPLVSLINPVLSKLYQEKIEFIREEAFLTLFNTLMLMKNQYGITHDEDLKAIAYCRIRYGEAIFRHQVVLDLLYHAKNEPRYVGQHIQRIIKTLNITQ